MNQIQTPIACTLDAADVPARAESIRALARDGILSLEHAARRLTLRYRMDPATRARVERFVDLESECCSFLAFDLRVSTLTIDAPAGAEPVLADFAQLLRRAA